MLRGEKPELVALKREDRSSDFKKDGFALGPNPKDYFYPRDAQYNGIMPQLQWVVYYDTGYGDLQPVFFVTEEAAKGWAQEKALGLMRGEKI